jgi:hypothetical protein
MCLTVMLTLLLIRLLTLTVVVGLDAAHCTAHLPQHVLAWSLLSLGWVGAIILVDWGLCWLFTRFILSFICLLICLPPCHNDITLQLFGSLPQSLQSSQPLSPLNNTLCPPWSHSTLNYPCPYKTPYIYEMKMNHPQHPPITIPNNLTTPAPIYDPTALAHYEIERSWVQKPGLHAMTNAEIEPMMQNSMQVVQWQEEGQGH